MPIKNFPFHSVASGQPCKPWLPIRIINPDTGLSIQHWGMLDTGADCCFIPAGVAAPLGHNLTAGSAFSFSTGNGPAQGYAHTTVIEIMNHQGGVVYTIPQTRVYFMPNLHIPLLGVTDFLELFKLTINYPAERFSITRPASVQSTNE